MPASDSFYFIFRKREGIFPVLPIAAERFFPGQTGSVNRFPKLFAPPEIPRRQRIVKGNSQKLSGISRPELF